MEGSEDRRKDTPSRSPLSGGWAVPLRRELRPVQLRILRSSFELQSQPSTGKAYLGLRVTNSPVSQDSKLITKRPTFHATAHPRQPGQVVITPEVCIKLLSVTEDLLLSGSNSSPLTCTQSRLQEHHGRVPIFPVGNMNYWMKDEQDLTETLLQLHLNLKLFQTKSF